MPDLDPEQLARLCFRRTPHDVVDRDVVLAALWHLHRRSAEIDLPAGSPHRAGLLGRDTGLRAHDYRAALAELVKDGLVTRDCRGVSLTRRGFAACLDIIDVGAVFAEQRRRFAA
jgi:hypothetical protein